MLFTASAWPGLADGSITVTFRTWKRAQARSGGRYRVAGMLLEATEVHQVAVADITAADARSAGEADLGALLSRLGDPSPDALVWRVDLRYVGADDRIERRTDDDLDDDAIEALRARLQRLDRHGTPWTLTTLRLIEKYPGVVSTALARRAGWERQPFKVNVRKLKELGLTESLGTGYRLSPRGAALLQVLS